MALARSPSDKLPNYDSGSFKDPEGRVFEHNGMILRTLSPGASKRMLALEQDGVLSRLSDRGLLIESKLVRAEDLGCDFVGISELVMQHAKIPVVSYPSEWSFDMMRDAALVTLDMLMDCIDKDLTLKDGTAFNVTFHEGRMQFFDTLSIDGYVEGTPWEGYTQFCREFLFPLMLTSFRGIEFQPFMKGSIGGIPVHDMSRLLAFPEKFRLSVLKHVILQNKLDRSFAGTEKDMRSSFEGIKFSSGMIRSNARSLRKTISSLQYRAQGSVWGDYESNNSYSAGDSGTKKTFILEAVKKIQPGRVVDLGGNTGTYSLEVASVVDQVVCVDIDPVAINRLYHRLRGSSVVNVLPLIGNLLDPTPSSGWNLKERRSLLVRLRSDAFLALALVHHLCIGGNVPIPQVVEVLHGLAPAGVVEWVDKSDPMVQRMLRNRSDVFVDYTWECFRLEVEKLFKIVAIEETHGGSRRLCLLRGTDKGAL